MSDGEDGVNGSGRGDLGKAPPVPTDFMWAEANWWMTVWMIDEAMKHMKNIWIWVWMNFAISVNDQRDCRHDLVRPWAGNPRTTWPYPGSKKIQVYEEMSPFPRANRQYRQVPYLTGPPNARGVYDRLLSTTGDVYITSRLSNTARNPPAAMPNVDFEMFRRILLYHTLKSDELFYPRKSHRRRGWQGSTALRSGLFGFLWA